MPDIASVVDDLCFIRSMWGANAAHGGAILAMNTGSDRFVRPSAVQSRSPSHPQIQPDRDSRVTAGESPRPCSDTE